MFRRDRNMRDKVDLTQQWEDLHRGTKSKIESIKQLIQKNVPYEQILGKKWYGQEERKQQWFEKFDAAKFFTDEELKALKIDVKVEEKKEDTKEDQVVLEGQPALEVSSEVEIPKESMNLPPTLDFTDVDTMIDTVNKMNDSQRLGFVSSPQFIKHLLTMMVDYKESKAREVLSVPDECRTEPVIVKSIRVSDKFYDAFTDVCKENNITITVGLNCALMEFAKKYKK